MPNPAELQALQRSIAELRSAVNSLSRHHGEVPVVARLRNDLERLILDVADVQTLASASAQRAAVSDPADGPTVFQVSDVPYDPALWRDDADDEGVGGYHGKDR